MKSACLLLFATCAMLGAQGLKGTITYTLEPFDLDKNFHEGDYVCTRGDDNHGPDCVKDLFIEKPAIIYLNLTHGKRVNLAGTKIAAAISEMALGLPSTPTGKHGEWGVTYMTIKEYDEERPLAQVKVHHLKKVMVEFPYKFEGSTSVKVCVLVLDETSKNISVSDAN